MFRDYQAAFEKPTGLPLSALLCAAGLWFVGVVLCAGRVNTRGASVRIRRAACRTDPARGARASGRRSPGSSGECCDDIRAFPAGEFLSFALVPPPSDAGLDFLASREVSPWTPCQRSHVAGSAHSRARAGSRRFSCGNHFRVGRRRRRPERFSSPRAGAEEASTRAHGACASQARRFGSVANSRVVTRIDSRSA